MADEGQDIFGQIDALFGKRAGFVSGASKLDDEIPLLTEVVTEPPSAAPELLSPVVDAMSTPATVPAPEVEAPTSVQLADGDLDRLAAALEARLSELLIRQQLRIESLVRRVVQEELEARRD